MMGSRVRVTQAAPVPDTATNNSRARRQPLPGNPFPRVTRIPLTAGINGTSNTSTLSTARHLMLRERWAFGQSTEKADLGIVLAHFASPLPPRLRRLAKEPGGITIRPASLFYAHVSRRLQWPRCFCRLCLLAVGPIAGAHALNLNRLLLGSRLGLRADWGAHVSA